MDVSGLGSAGTVAEVISLERKKRRRRKDEGWGKVERD